MVHNGGGDLDARVGAPEAIRAVFDSMPIMLVGSTGADHVIAAVNEACRVTLGRDQMAGLPLREIFPEVIGQQLYELADRVYRTGTPQVGRQWRVQLDRAGQRDEIYVDFTMTPRRDSGGVIVGLNVYAVDATERVAEQRRARQEMADAQERYARARDVITALQRQLLPPGLPVLPAVRIAGSYLLADAEDAAGGDWFDAVPVAGGRVALVVGDVVGHGVAASAAMGQLRAVLHDRLDETGDVRAAVAAADRMAGRLPGARAATVCVVLLDPGDGTLVHCAAGHPPPLVTGPAGTRYLLLPGGGPLGTGAEYAAATDRIGPDDVLLLYTDGILERPGREPQAATVELAQVADDAVAGRGLHDSGTSAVDRACTHTLELLVRQTGHTDDITLLAAGLRTPVPPLRLTLDAGQSSIRTARAAMTRWLYDQDAGDQDVTALAHAVTELVTNAVEHSHPDSPAGTVVVTASLGEGGHAVLRVTDDGRWRERDRPGSEEFRRDRGLGLAMTAQFVDHLDIDRGAAGTTATVHHRLTRPARLLTDAQVGHGTTRPAGDLPELLLMLDQPQAPGSRIAVHGPVDATTVDQFATELDRLTLGGTHALTVDLTAVTHLASAAVAVLHARARSLRLYSPAGSTAHHVLTLVGLAHHVQDPDAGPSG